MLAHLAADRNLHDDLKDPEVKVAMRHWTGEERLPPNSEVLLRFQDNYRIMATLGKIQRLQSSCRALGIALPLDHVLKRKTELDPRVLSSRINQLSNQKSEQKAPKIDSLKPEAASSAPSSIAPEIKTSRDPEITQEVSTATSEKNDSDYLSYAIILGFIFVAVSMKYFMA